MPKRSIDATASPASNEMPVARVMRKTERSHEENQERAYIAASRRADRSIEARVQSAKMASEIHKKRTGKSFKISEEIVVKEEMYEEEDDDLPRQYRQLAAHLQTSSPEMNTRLSAYLTNSVAMASLARQREVDRMFAEAYPNANRVSQQMTDSMYYKPLQTQQSPQSPQSAQAFGTPTSPHFAPMQFGQNQAHSFGRDRSQSISSHSEALSPRTHASHVPDSPVTTRRSTTDVPSNTPVLSHGNCGNVSTSSKTSTSQLRTIAAFDFASVNPSQAVNPAATTSAPTHVSSFTSELPANIKQLAGLDMSDPLSTAFLGGNSTFEPYNDMPWPPCSYLPPSGSQGSHTTPTMFKGPSSQSAFADNYFDAGMHMHTKHIDGDVSGTGTPNWDSFVDSNWAGAN